MTKTTLTRCCATLAVACAATAIADDAPVVHDYVVTVDDTLEALTVEARFATAVKSVTARSRNAGRYLSDVRDCEGDQRIRMRNRRMLLPASGVRCLRYTVELREAAREVRSNRTLAPGNIIVSPGYWLWRPEVRGTTEVRVAFRLPESVGVSVPWKPVPGRADVYRFGASPESARAPAVFGDFDQRIVSVGDADLRVSLLQGTEPMDNDAMTSWISAAATDVTLAYGRFPNPFAQIVVIPVGGMRGNSRSVVPFGRVIRDGGETVELLVNQHQPLEALLGDWTAPHEFSHLMVPFFDRQHRWISEGFAQYYQNVLLTRSGAYEERYAWQKLHDGYERGRKSRPELSPNGAATRGARGALMKYYWSGAALALLADVTLRERTSGRESLDVALDRFQDCCLPATEPWTGPEFFERLDSLVSTPVFMPLYRRHADTVGFPDVSGVLSDLGVAVSSGRVRLQDNTELADVRLAMTATDPATATWRRRLVSD